LKLALELYTNRPVALRLGTFFETWIATTDGTLRRSLGRDEYHFNLHLDANRRLAATGRTHICQVDLEAVDLGINQARKAILTAASAEPIPPILWGIRTNLYLDLPSLVESTSALLLRENSPSIPFDLNHERVHSLEIAPGRYLVDLSGLLG
jgi:hypothetical protein